VTPSPGAEATDPEVEAASGAEQPAASEAEQPAATGTAAALDQALAGAHRSADNRARDGSRHPKQTLLFFGLEPHMTVIELAPGGGWYTEVLAPVLCQGGGKLIGTIPSLEGEGAKYAQRFIDRMAQDPKVFGCVEPITVEPPAQTSLGPDGSADMVLTFRSTHGWINRDQAGAVYASAFRVLKPGGIFGVVQHRAADGANVKESAKTGYVPEAHVIELATEAGFELVERSDINRNAKDTHDYPEGVWTLPPSLRLGDKDRDKYMAIGESDRMTLKFRKP
jgi:predicted methyltransferase